MGKERYIILKEDELFGTASSIQKIAKLINCTRAHIYKYLKNGVFTHKKITYEIIDKLD